MARMAAASSISPMNPEMSAATIKSTIMKSVNWPKNIRQALRGACSRISLRPCVCRRCAASAAVKPRSRLVRSCCARFGDGNDVPIRAPVCASGAATGLRAHRCTSVTRR